MTVVTLYPKYDGYIYSNDNTYETARVGAALASSSSGSTLYTAQRLVAANYRCYEAFLGFDTTAIPADAVVSSAVLRVAVTTDGSTTDFVLEAREYTVGGAVTTAMWVDANDLGGYDLLASLTTAGLPGVPTEMVLTSAAAMLAAVNPYGITGFVVTSDRMRAGTVPVGDEYLIAPSVEDADVADRPTLTVTYTAGTPVFGTATPVLTTPAEAAFVASQVAAENDPEWSAWVELRDGVRLSDAVAFVAGVGNTDYTRVAFICESLDTASRHARNLATAYMCSGTASYAEKTRDILVYWANYGDPPNYATTTEYNYGFHMSWGGYAFALAYDLTKGSAEYSAADHALLFDWFVAWAECEKSYALHWVGREAYAFSRTTETQAYEWTTNPLGLENNILDRYTAMDNPAGIMHAWYAAICVTGYTSQRNNYLYDSRFALNILNMQHCATAPRNDGDGVTGHENPVPCVQVYKDSYVYAPPGCTTYLSFDGRFHTLIYKMARNDRMETAAMTAGIAAYWNYICRYAGADAETPPQGSGDVYDMDYLISCLQLAANAVGHARGLVEVTEHGSSALYESQSSGYTLLTAPYVPDDFVPVLPPGYDTRNWTLKIGTTDFANVEGRVSGLKWLRGEHGPADLSCTLHLDYDSRLPTELNLNRGDVVELWDGTERLWYGFLCSPAPATDQTIAITAKGEVAWAKDNGIYSMIWTIMDYDLWSTDQSEDTQNRNFAIDIDGRLRIRVESEVKIRKQGATNEDGRIYFILPTWMTELIQKFTASYAVTNPYDDTDPWPMESRLNTKHLPQGSVMADNPVWEIHDHVNGTGNDSGTMTLTFDGVGGNSDPCEVLQLKFVCIGAAGSWTTLVPRQVLLTDCCVYVRQDHKCRVDEALVDLFTDTGMATTFVVPANIGGALDTIAILEPTSPADGAQTIAELHDWPVRWHIEAGVATIEERPTASAGRTRQWVIATAPVGNDLCPCSGYDVQTKVEDAADFIAVDFNVKGDSDYIDGTRMRVIYPASPTPGPLDRVTRLDYPEDVNVTAAKALNFATREYQIRRLNAAVGPMPLDSLAITNVDGVSYPAWQAKENEFVKVLDDPDCPAEGHYLTGVEWDSSRIILHTGNSELSFSPKKGRLRRHHPRPLRLPKGYWKDKEHRKKGTGTYKKPKRHRRGSR